MSATTAKDSFSKENSLALKGVGILLLMGMHCFGSYGRFKGYDINFWPFQAEDFVSFCAYLKISVSLFAFISGYGLYLSASKTCLDSKSSTKWLIQRYFKTFSGYWFVFVLFVIITQLWVGLPEEKYFDEGGFRGIAYMVTDFFGLARMFNTPRLNGSWWYMGAAMFYILLTPFICAGDKRFGLIPVSALLIIFPRVITASDYYGHNNAYSFLFVFLMGMIFAKYRIFDKIEDINIKGNKTAANVLFFLFMCVALPVSYLLYKRVPIDELWEYNYGIAPLFVIVFCQKFLFKIPFITKVLGFCGKHSMNVFLYHTFLRGELIRKELYSIGNAWFVMLALFGISVIISIIIEFIKKLIKYDEKINKLSKRICDFAVKE